MGSLIGAELPDVVAEGWVGLIAVPAEMLVPDVDWVVIADDACAGLVEVVVD